ncbi:MAG: hypothetical protein JNM02_08420 [Anaerolineales bacterium]|nr:hypothetical protein [Anaerolineales bacterium]
MKSILLVTASGILAAVFLFSPHHLARAQGGCVDASGGSIPCPPTEEKQEDQKNTPVFIPPTLTSTSTSTNTPTSTPSPTSSPSPTATKIPDTATPTITPTSTNTPTPTPIPIAQSALPGAGIGALILFLIVGLLLPAIQKIRVARRGY